ncbi:UvrD-helicase domain-containing protein [Desulfovibrio intestinalis]|uniref:DNA helicase-2/ATP-dependent DNA helicase PcrA n=1 Tax=Desulfovibrio intestinalis TaxID=58621 RepID=A0A7W8C3U6_9BACT|nr:ATP-dependent helicase [Desulfovibrio intestinalis]MBB5143205.1 DNA helicase-2/ATP-dependent DNA helicase PcrA [Desulfovibrio intestinalis]
MRHEQLFEEIASLVCGKPQGISAEECKGSYGSRHPLCSEYSACRINEKTREQLEFVCEPSNLNIHLAACPGSGKTESVALRAAHIIKTWPSSHSGVAVLTFTNNAASVIKSRTAQLIGAEAISSPHFIGTIDSWIHGFILHPFSHLLTKYEGKQGDKSMRLIENDSRSPFLKHYESYYGMAQTGKLKAHEFYYTTSGKIIFSSADKGNDTKREQVRLVDWQVKDLSKTKLKFWKAGFCTYQDAEILCFRLIKNHAYFKKLFANRFRLIIIDECQDLSPVQIDILDQLLDSGVKINLVGDLNQAIYKFRHVDINIIKNFIQEKNIKTLALSVNHRSCQSIVNTCNKLIAEVPPPQGMQHQLLKNPCVCLCYPRDKIAILPQWFNDNIMSNECVRSSAILARGWSTVNKMRPSKQSGARDHEKFARSIYCWGINSIEEKKIAFENLGDFITNKFLQKSHFSRQNFFCPDECTPKDWRIFLSGILTNIVTSHQYISDLNQSWAAWIPKVLLSINDIVFNELKKSPVNCLTESFQKLDGRRFKKPQNGNDNIISNYVGNTISAAIDTKITTIHSVKGETFDAVMVVSSSSKSGSQDSHWEHWLENQHNEAARIAYVASSRPRHWLIWAIPSPNQEQKERLKQFGFELTSI